MIKSILEITQERIDECMRFATEAFAPVCRPIYGRQDDGYLIHLASGLFLKIDKCIYIVTAAHVLDAHTDVTLCMGVNEVLIDLEGDFFCTNAPNGKRKLDKYDFAFKKLTERDKQNFGKENFISQTSYNQLKTDDRLYMTLGYPNSKNMPCKMKKVIAPKQYPFANMARMTADHLYLSYDDKKLRGVKGAKVNSIKLNGISGGPLIDLGQISHPNKLSSEPTAVLCGMIIEQRGKEVMCVKIGVIIEAIRDQQSL